MDFSPNKTLIEVIKEGAFVGTYFRDIYSNVNKKWYKKSSKEFNQLKNIDQKYYQSDFYDVSVNKYSVKCGISLRFWENKVGLMKQILMASFSGILGIDQVEDQKMIKEKLIDGKKVVNRFKGKLVNMIKDNGSKFDDYSIQLKIRQILLHWVMN